MVSNTKIPTSKYELIINISATGSQEVFHLAMCRQYPTVMRQNFWWWAMKGDKCAWLCFCLERIHACVSIECFFVIALLVVFLLPGFEFHPDRRQSNGLSLQSSPALPAADRRTTCRSPGTQRGVLGWHLCVRMCKRSLASPVCYTCASTVQPRVLLTSPQWDCTSSGAKRLLPGAVWPTTGGLSPGSLPCASQRCCLAPCWSHGSGRGWAGGVDVLWCGIGTY